VSARAKTTAPETLIVRASQVPSRSIRWAWTGWLAVGYLAVVSGVEGLGKSLWAAWMLSRLTRGELTGDWQGQPVDVLVIDSEDGIADTWRPRLELAGANLDRVAFLELDRLPLGWNLRDGITQVEQAVEQAQARMVFIGAMLDHLPAPRAGESINSPTWVRGALGPLRTLVREKEIVGQFSMHPPKSRSADFRDLVQASQAFSAIPRVGQLLAYHPHDDAEDPERRRVVIRGKGNIGRPPTAIEFRIAARAYEHDDGRTTDREFITDVGPSQITLADLAPERAVGTTRDPPKAEQAAQHLREVLADGKPHPASPIRAELDARGLGGDSVLREARRKAGVRAHKRKGVQDGGWEWQLVTANDALTPSPPRARYIPAQDAFKKTTTIPSSKEKASRRHPPQPTTPPNGRRLSAAALRAREQDEDADLDDTLPATAKAGRA
jgi:putative DNA primase/helicase